MKIKKLILLMLALIMCLSSFALVGCKEDDDTNDDIPQVETPSEDDTPSEEKPQHPYELEFQLSADKTYYSLIDLLYPMDTYNKTLIIPSEYEGLPVKKIKHGALSYTGFSQIIVPDSVTIIEPEAFVWCTKLSQITLSNNISTIQSCTFGKCYSLKSIVLPESLTKIEGGAFCKSGLESIDIPDTVEEIGDSAFAGCDSLTNVKLPKNLQILWGHAFYSTKITSITIFENIRYIGSHVFTLCDSLESVFVKLDKEQWENVEVYGVTSFMYIYSETEPELNEDNTAYNGRFWHYVDGVETIWEYTP